MNQYLYLLFLLIIPISVFVFGELDNTKEFSYPFILGFLICLILMNLNRKKEDNQLKLIKNEN